MSREEETNAEGRGRGCNGAGREEEREGGREGGREGRADLSVGWRLPEKPRLEEACIAGSDPINCLM
jgi:hypothetical protein